MRVRCKWYDDEGQPFGNGGCRAEHTTCTYIHPSSNEWATAQRRSTATATRDRGRGRGGGFSSPSSRDSGWNNRRKSLNTEEWDTEGWKSKPSKAPASSSGSVSSSTADPQPSASKVFGAWGTGPSTSTSSGGGGGWGDSNDKKDTDSGWGWGAPPSAKEADAWGTVSGWGTSATTTATKDTESGKSSDGGWGTSTSATGTKAGGWGSESGWGTTTTTQDKSTGWGGGWGTTSTATATQDNSSGGGWGGGGWGGKAPIDDQATPSQQPSSAKPTTRPNDLRVDVEDQMAVDAPLPPLSASSSSYRPGSRAPSIGAGTPQSAFPPFAVLGHVPTRTELHSGIVKTSVRATCIQLELRELQRQLTAFKATRNSAQFQRISMSGGARLDQIYSQLKDNVNSTQTRVLKVEEELVKFPELPSSAPNTVDVDREMMSYTEDLERWLRSFMALAVPETRPPAAPSPSAMDVEPIPDPKQGPEVLAEIDQRIANLKGQLEEMTSTMEDLYSPETNAATIDEAIQAARKRSQSEQSPELTAEDNAAAAAIAKMQSTASGVQQKFNQYAEQVVELLDKNELGKTRIEALEKQRKENHSLYLDMKTQLEEFEERKKQRALQLQMMSAAFARFAKNPNPAPVLDETVLERVKANVSVMIDNEVIPALQGLGIRYTEAIDRRSESLRQSIQPAVDMTSDICQRAEQIEVDA